MSDENRLIERAKIKVNQVSPSFCLAKWLQSTIHLQTGMTHSCHHPAPHKIPLNEIKRNPSALHNTMFKKMKRKEMQKGIRPKECDYCWKVEDANPDSFSDRHMKSHEHWALPHLDKVKRLHFREDVNPTYLEISFSNACNMQCSYCGPQFSSKWMEEIENKGAYPTSTRFNNLENLKRTNTMPIPHREENPYVEAFWEWWPELYRSLDTFRITGGEPLLSRDTFKVLDYIIDNPNPNKNLNLSINSNLMVPDSMYEKFIEKLNIITDNNLVKHFVLFTSVDTHGEQANYIRNGMDYDIWLKRVHNLFKVNKKIHMNFMTTFNALSLPRFDLLLKDIYDIKQEYKHANRFYIGSCVLDIAYLRWPPHQQVKILPQEWSKKILEYADLMDGIYGEEQNPAYTAFYDFEVEKMKRLYDWMIEPVEESWLIQNRKDFYSYFTEHDKRRGTDFCKTFPELEEFYNQCGKL